jgi:uncharacterized membrane protein YqjE
VTEQDPTRALPPLEPPGLISGISGVARNILGLLVSRVELAALELSEVRNNLLKLLLVAALGIFTGLFAFAFLTVLVVYLCWDALGWKILMILAGIFTAATIAIVLYVKSMLTSGKLSIPATLGELARDRDALL